MRGILSSIALLVRLGVLLWVSGSLRGSSCSYERVLVWYCERSGRPKKRWKRFRRVPKRLARSTGKVLTEVRYLIFGNSCLARFRAMTELETPAMSTQCNLHRTWH